MGFDLIITLITMKTQSISRRDFLKTSITATAALAAAKPTNLFAAGEYGGNKIPFGLQLFSVRNECAKDLDGTVAAVAKMGYKAVEFAGYHGRDAKALRKLLDDVGLKCCEKKTGPRRERPRETLVESQAQCAYRRRRTAVEGDFTHLRDDRRRGVVPHRI